MARRVAAISILLSLVVSILVSLSAVPAEAQAPDGTVAGDANCNGITDSVDALVVLQFDAGLIPSVPCAVNADVTGDGVNNAVDAVLILQFTAGLFPHFV